MQLRNKKRKTANSNNHHSSASTAHAWLVQNLLAIEQSHSGQWLAITEKGIIATSTDSLDVYELALEQGIANALIILLSPLAPPAAPPYTRPKEPEGLPQWFSKRHRPSVRQT